MRRIPLENLELEYCQPPDELALDRVCASRFYDGLTRDEADFVDASIHCLEGRNSEFRTMRELGVDRPRCDDLRRSTYQKFLSIFGTGPEAVE